MEVIESFRAHLLNKINSALNEVISKMRVASELHINSLTDLLDYSSKGLVALTVLSSNFSH